MSQEHVDHPQERRLVTILFADLVGYTSVSETRDSELIQTILSLCFDRLSSEIKRFGGYVDKVVGDELMALFGACAVPKLHPYLGERRVANQDRRMPAEAVGCQNPIRISRRRQAVDEGHV